MADTGTAPEDLGAPQSFLVLDDGSPVYDPSGEKAGTVAHVLSDDRDEIFQGLVIKTGDGHRYAPASAIEGIYEHGVVLLEPAAGLHEPTEDPGDDHEESGLRRAWNWLIQPK
jgi:hypothetical protein